MSFRLRPAVSLTPITLADATQVWQVDDPGGTPVYVDETVDFNDVGTADVDVWPDPEAVGDRLVVMYSRPFRRLRLTISTAGTAGTMAVKYWNGTAWVAVAGLTDPSTGLTAGTSTYDLTWTMPSDWARLVINGSPNDYPLALEVATEYTVLPVLSQGRIVRGTPLPIPATNGGGGHGKLRIYGRNTDVSGPAYLVAAGQDAAGARQMAASGGLLPHPTELDHVIAEQAPPELWSDVTAPSPVVVEIDVAGGA